AAYEAAREEGDFPEPEAGQTVVTDLSLKADLQAKEVYTSPDNIMTEEEALDLLLSGRPVEQDYTAAEGDTPGSVAEMHGMDLEQLIELNPEMDQQAYLVLG